jgi:CHAD domain-containing protein
MSQALLRAIQHNLKLAGAALRKSHSREALHDFRVSLRRVRSLLKGFGPMLGLRAAGLERELKALSRKTNRGRDLEILTDWLNARHKKLLPSCRTGLIPILQYFERLRSQLKDGSSAELGRRFAACSQKLAGLLKSPRKVCASDAASVPAALEKARLKLTSRLSQISNLRQETEIHKARISAKRLRYMLEPFAPTSAKARVCTQRLKSLQTLLGDIHDRHMIRLELALRAGKTRHSRESAQGIELLLEICAIEERKLFQEFKRFCSTQGLGKLPQCASKIGVKTPDNRHHPAG